LKSARAAAFEAIQSPTVAFYGPTDRVATKVTAGIIPAEGRDAEPLERWVSEGSEIRSDDVIARAIGEFIETHRAASVVLADRIIGCPHEEGVDYPLGVTCPECPFWANRDRWTGQLVRGNEGE